MQIVVMQSWKLFFFFHAVIRHVDYTRNLGEFQMELLFAALGLLIVKRICQLWLLLHRNSV